MMSSSVEKVLCASTAELSKYFDLRNRSWRFRADELEHVATCFIERPLAEQNFSYKQLIPYAVLFNLEGEVLSYRRRGTEQRLFGVGSIGIGGHVNESDRGAKLYDTLLNGLLRELHEELGLSLSPQQVELQGMINEDESEVGRCHIGLVFTIDLGKQALRPDREIGQAEWISIDQVDDSGYELWSRLAAALIGSRSEPKTFP